MAEPDHLLLQFDAFELNESDARLTRAGQPVALAPKAFDVLCALARQPGKLVTKSALLDAVWGHQHVSESVLKSTISELRAALADDARQPRFIETASRRGYRFVGLSRQAGATSLVDDVAPATGVPELVGRKDALRRLQSCWATAKSGRRQVFWIAGEAGVGKTTLIEAFVATSGASIVARGQCVEQTGAGEPYLPVLEALGELCRGDTDLVALLRSVAPTWLAQMPWLCTEAERDVLGRSLAGSGPQRMLRELGELLDRYTQERPLLLVTEDLHWSDHATIRLIDYFARRRNPSRIMWLASFRLAEVISEDHPLKALRHELRMHRLCEEILLDPFSESEVAEYVAERFPHSEAPEAFVRMVHSHTDGLPLFVVNVIEDLISQGELREDSLARFAPDRLQVPENLAGVIEKQIARLSDEDRSLLETAAICGVEFRPTVVADALARDPAWVAARCEALAGQQHWLDVVAVSTRADGSLDGRFAFRHALYRHVFYQRIGGLTRAQLHRGVAVSLARAQAAGAPVAAAELALHHERSHDIAAALQQYALAAIAALRQFAPIEAVKLTAQALALLPRLPDNLERKQLELTVVAPRAVACAQSMGIASPEARAAFERAYVLCDVVPQSGARAMELSGLGWVYYARGEYAQALAVATRIHALSLAQADGMLEVASSNLMGATLAHQGELESGRQWLENGLRVFDALGERVSNFPTVVDLKVSLASRLAHVLSQLGLADSARRQAADSIARADAIEQPYARMIGQFFAAIVEVRLDEPARARELAEAMQQTVADHAFVQGDGLWRWIKGWAMARQGEAEPGYALILEGFEHHMRISMFSGAASVLGHAAETALLLGREAEARKHLEEGFALAAKTGEGIFLPDLHLASARVAAQSGDAKRARADATKALDLARAQQAGWPELQALVCLCELSDANAQDRASLNSLCQRLTEGRETSLFRRALDLAG
ncbi:MAG TPA: AAA family ATPase [Burkholderiales bacterium]|nr:AAA family ATPase [Burkholderiales bacterium]